MSLRIQLHTPHNSFTNLDVIQGRLYLSLVNPETIAAITLKLESESRTRLAGLLRAPNNYDVKETTQLEVHKLLYKVVTVFPTQDLLRTSTRAQYTLQPGQHNFDFAFKIPFNNDCQNNNSLLANLSSIRMDTQRDSPHVRKTLPPSLSGLPGEAEIRYFVKATVQRPSLFKENFRSLSAFMFFPIEPPRPAPNTRESYARRTHRFAPSIEQSGRAGRLATGDSDAKLVPPSITIDGRLPDPAILTCNEPLPLRILVTKENGSSATIFLQMLHIELVGYTNIRARDLRRTEVNGWTVFSKADMRMPLLKQVAEKDGSVFEIDSSLWKAIPLPNTVAPTFETCNISRNYALNIKVGLSWGIDSVINPELTVQPIRMPCEVYSGIAPPQKLLAAMASQPQRPTQPQVSTVQGRPPSSNGRPPSHSRPSQSDHIEPSPGDIPDDAPPSYEDAMAADLGPIDGPRRDYTQQELPPGTFGLDEKRLFPES